jgi:hypothetical protein
LFAVKSGRDGLQAEARGDAPRVDGESAFGAPLRHKLDPDAAVGPCDDQLAELPELVHGRVFGPALADFDDLVGFVHEAVATEEDSAAEVLEVVAVCFHMVFSGGIPCRQRGR